MENGKRTLGILGGMGPSATVDFMAKIIAETHAAKDQDNVPMIVRNVPQIPDRSAAIMDGSDAPLPAMLAGIQMLTTAGADVLAIPCNTAHYWYDALAARTEHPIIHIADSVRRQLVLGRTKAPVALMSTRGTIRAGVYRRLDDFADRLILPDEECQELVDRAITGVKAGLGSTTIAEQAVARLLDAGACKVILACTELPIAMAGSSLESQCIDATLALAKDCVAASMGRLDS